MIDKAHISICICTYKRPRQLDELLTALERQGTEGLFDFSIVVVDNDSAGTALVTIESHARRSAVPISAYIEPEQNIALARNRAVGHSQGQFVAFIDDDERPDERWLLSHYLALTKSAACGVLGPVLPRFESPPPAWVLRSRMFDRERHPSGFILDWKRTRSGNCLFRRSLFEADKDWFRKEFGRGGEDRDFFRRKISQGCLFVWNDDAPVYEIVQSNRWSAKSMLKRSLLRGRMSSFADRHNPLKAMISYVAIHLYTIVLPFLFLFSPVYGFEVFMNYLVKDFDHLGRLLALVNFDPVKEKYIM